MGGFLKIKIFYPPPPTLSLSLSHTHTHTHTHSIVYKVIKIWGTIFFVTSIETIFGPMYIKLLSYAESLRV